MHDSKDQALAMSNVNGPNESGVVVVMVPLPAQGHLNQMLHLSRLLSTKGIPVYYTGSAVHNRQAKSRVQGWDPSTISNIHFHDFPLPPFATPPPDPTAFNKFPEHLTPTFEASTHVSEHLSGLLKSLSNSARRVIVVHDTLMSFAAKEASLVPNCEPYALQCISTFAILAYIWEYLGQPKIPLFPDELFNQSLIENYPEQFAEFIQTQHSFMEFDVGDLHNTCGAIESRFIDMISTEEFSRKKRRWAIGPLHPVVTGTDKGSPRRHKCLEWLEKQPVDSVLYVSFGTMTSISDEQITEIALGLERSEQRFIWAIREADRGDIYAEDEKVRTIQVPEGYEDRVEGRGMIVRDWAPQVEILAHPATGGFLSHCGWNSCIESMSMGVPIAAWPMHSDQPRNTVLLTKVLNIALTVRDWETRERIVSSATIESAVRKLMVGEEGKDVRTRAKELGVAVRQATSEGGSSTLEVDSFIAHISR